MLNSCFRCSKSLFRQLVYKSLRFRQDRANLSVLHIVSDICWMLFRFSWVVSDRNSSVSVAWLCWTKAVRKCSTASLIRLKYSQSNQVQDQHNNRKYLFTYRRPDSYSRFPDYIWLLQSPDTASTPGSRRLQPLRCGCYWRTWRPACSKAGGRWA